MIDFKDYSTLRQIQTGLLERKITAEELVRYYLINIEGSKFLNIYIEVFAEEALRNAKALDQKIAHRNNKLGSLFGMVLSIKDVICYGEHKISAASKILQDFESQYTATALNRVLAEDAIVIGRTNCDEFAMGSSNENSFYGPTKNGDDSTRIPGGSSGAAAVSVQMDTCLIALGSDTGGSVRQPAGFCGVTGFKPSYGRISRYGLIAYGSSFDQIGVIAKTVEDIALSLEVLAGEDEYDNTSSSREVEKYSDFQEMGKCNFVIFREVLNHSKLNVEIKYKTLEFLNKLENKDHVIDFISYEYLDYLVPCYYVLTTAEASSNLARYDGIRYGYRYEKAHTLSEMYEKTRTLGFGKEVKRRIMLGTFVLSSGYYDAYYNQAQKVRRLIRDSLNKLFDKYDYIIVPTSTDVAWTIGTFENDPVEVYLSDIFTVLANLTGSPAISIPLGRNKAGLSFGIQVISKNFQEKSLLNAAYHLNNLA